MNKLKSKTKGDEGEAMAEDFLKDRGFKILERNYRFDRGEIDLIAKDGGELVFVEVKCRHTRSHGTPEEAITQQKEHYLKRTAEGYLFEHNIDKTMCRFDVVAIEWTGSQADIRHLKNVF